MKTAKTVLAYQVIFAAKGRRPKHPNKAGPRANNILWLTVKLPPDGSQNQRPGSPKDDAGWNLSFAFLLSRVKAKACYGARVSHAANP
jgi:hypothetical protein